MTTRKINEIRVRVTPNSSREYIEEAPFSTLRIGVREPTEDNRANERMRELLAGRFSVPIKNVQIIKGARERSKIVRVYL